MSFPFALIVASLAIACFAGVGFAKDQEGKGIVRFAVAAAFAFGGVLFAVIGDTPQDSGRDISLVVAARWQQVEACKANGGTPLTELRRIPGTFVQQSWVLRECVGGRR